MTNKSISVEANSNSYFSLIESKFPIGFNRIDWSHVRNALFYEVMPFDLPEYPLDYRLNKLEEVRGTIADWFRLNSIQLNDRIIAVGDVSNVALHMSVATFFECYPILFTSSQHIYLLSADAEWCLHYTIEDTLNFGLAKSATAVGSVVSPDE